MMFRTLIGSLLLAPALGACTTQPANSADGVYDPLEPMNRQIFAFNEAADKAVIGPVAGAYETVTPKFARIGIGNFLSNLSSPVIFVNDVLQGEGQRATDTAFRFLINSTFGVAGFFDPAEHELGVIGHSEDFGQTLGVWGVSEGPYLVLPLIGPTNLRDGIGSGVDTAFDPLTWMEFKDENLDDQIALTRGVLSALQARVALDDQLETL
ncbi:MAG: VacJ family lipoprotein, partial [Hyphomonadaceae bacterium]|nr:VacJ family lipoprotein [Hyphomonadaceae bacterium]